ncbi:LysR family transcriptional regulator [Nisaea sp.]|uniref:LysR family transcriptional regulator n=1 Tax=Nisaea sp. TaxID=2024842 RepID=UPI0032647FD1
MNLNRLAYFAAVVDTGSFTRAAERLGVTKAVVSQQVAHLEQDLRTTLLVRTTRRVQPTEAGRMFHARCVLILREAEDAFDELAQAAAEPTGILRITAPNDYGTAVVVAVLAAFTARYPACRVELTLSDDTVDLVSGRIDMAIRVGWLADSSLQARKIGSFRQLLVGAPAFADQISAARDPEDLAALPFIANMALREPLRWHFSRGDLERRAVNMQASIAIDTTPGVLAAVRAGGGLSVLPDFLVADDLASGRLSVALPEWRLPSGGIYSVYPAARFRPTKVTAFVEMLIAAERRTRLEVSRQTDQ